LSEKNPESNKEIVETEEKFDTTYTHNDIYLTAYFPGLIPASQEQYIFQILLWPWHMAHKMKTDKTKTKIQHNMCWTSLSTNKHK